jgi:hypothetical protein
MTTVGRYAYRDRETQGGVNRVSKSVARDVQILGHPCVGVAARHIGEPTQVVIDIPLLDVFLDRLVLLVVVAKELEFVDAREVLAAILLIRF